jgi:hypothetical protein
MRCPAFRGENNLGSSLRCAKWGSDRTCAVAPGFGAARWGPECEVIYSLNDSEYAARVSLTDIERGKRTIESMIG